MDEFLFLMKAVLVLAGCFVAFATSLFFASIAYFEWCEYRDAKDDNARVNKFERAARGRV